MWPFKKKNKTKTVAPTAAESVVGGHDIYERPVLTSLDQLRKERPPSKDQYGIPAEDEPPYDPMLDRENPLSPLYDQESDSSS